MTNKCASVAASDHALEGGLRRLGENLYVCERHDMRILGCHVYAIVARELSRVKIGATAHAVKERMIALQVASPCKLEILRYAHADWPDEQKLHRLLARFHVIGEWFFFVPESRSIIFQFMSALDAEYPEADCRYDITPKDPDLNISTLTVSPSQLAIDREKARGGKRDVQ